MVWDLSMRVLVTGYKGYIGSVLIPILLEQGHKIRGIDIDLFSNFDSKEPNDKLRDHIVESAFQRGLLLLGCGTSAIRFSPPLSVSRSEVDEAMEVFEDSLIVSESGLDKELDEVGTVAA